MHELDYQAIQRQAERRLRGRIAFFAHIFLFVALAPGLNANPIYRGFGSWWLLFVVIHMGFWLYGELRERAVRRAIEREEERLAHLYALRGDKPKHYDHLALGDDGELLEADKVKRSF